MSSRRDDDLVDLLDDLELTLSDLRDDLKRRPEGRRRRRFRPPTPGEVLRFTDEYTIPTVISILEANIRALELLQKLLHLANPERTLRDGEDRTRRRVRNVRDGAVDGLDRALSELQRALSEADLPDDPESRNIVEDARDLTAEVERRLGESRSGSRSRSARSRRTTDRDSRSGPVEIAIDEEPDGGETYGTDSGGEREEDEVDNAEIDVESELQSIKDELDDREDRDDPEDREDRDDPDR